MTAKRRVPVAIDELSGVFELHFDEISSYLDLETGKVLQGSDETRMLLSNSRRLVYNSPHKSAGLH